MTNNLMVRLLPDTVVRELHLKFPAPEVLVDALATDDASRRELMREVVKYLNKPSSPWRVGMRRDLERAGLL